MRNLISKVGVLILGLLIVSVSIYADDSMEELRKTIQQLNVQMANAAMEGDVEKALSYYTDDAISLPNYGEMLKGKESIKGYQVNMNKVGVKIHSFNSTILDLWACGDMVYEIGKYGLSLTLPGMFQPIADNGKYLTIWKKQSDGSLKIKLEIWNTDINPMAMGK